MAGRWVEHTLSTTQLSDTWTDQAQQADTTAHNTLEPPGGEMHTPRAHKQTLAQDSTNQPYQWQAESEHDRTNQR
jgi:hypothetical protein